LQLAVAKMKDYFITSQGFPYRYRQKFKKFGEIARKKTTF
jgi:hypothetical protein